MEVEILDSDRTFPDEARGGDCGFASSAIAEYVEALLADAVRKKASDLHFESFPHGMAIRRRILGTLQTIVRIQADVMHPILARLKVMANLNIQERFQPQDGRFERTIDGRKINFRLSLIPTRAGESLVLRILDRSAISPALDSLGLPEHILCELRRFIHMTHGLFLVIGPTGSGKTTTLYSLLREMDRRHQKILTVEDPVEYELENLMQSSVDLAAGRSFDCLLRAFLRHDPDRILIGEIRDSETAKQAIRAALTGHAVFATLHAATFNNAILRLLGLGVEPFLLSSSLRGMLNQRLVKILCPNCAKERPLSLAEEKIFNQLGMKDLEIIRGAVGCDACNGTGFVRRHAIFDYCYIDGLRKGAIAAGRLAAIKNSNDLLKIAQELLMRGETTADEIIENLMEEK